MLIKLHLKPTGGNYKQMYKYMIELKINSSHFLGKSHLRDKTHNWSPKILLEDILVENNSYQSHKLRLRLIKDKIFEPKCDICELQIWLDLPISLELDHINGNNSDNRIVNLRLLCPNCHAQTGTYRGKNKTVR